MSLIRCGEEGFKAYIYMHCNGHLQFHTSLFTGAVDDYNVAKFIINTLIEKQEVPADMLLRLHKAMLEVEANRTRDWDKLFNETVVKVN